MFQVISEFRLPSQQLDLEAPQKAEHWQFKKMYLVGGFNPFEKYARQIGSFPQGSG